ncbi:MAG: hypothetical protein U0174_13645 [Polyangiaceae bacterium]
MKRSWTRSLYVASTLAFATAFVLPLAFSEEESALAAPPKPAPRRAPPKPRTMPDAGTKDAGALAPDAGTLATGGGAAVGGSVEAKTLDGGAKVYRFGEVEIEGRLKSPQIVYFLRRVRAEFAAGDLGHRSFMKELSDTRNQGL